MKARGGRRCTHLLELVFEAEEVALVLVDVQLRLGAEGLDRSLARVHLLQHHLLRRTRIRLGQLVTKSIVLPRKLLLHRLELRVKLRALLCHFLLHLKIDRRAHRLRKLRLGQVPID